MKRGLANTGILRVPGGQDEETSWVDVIGTIWGWKLPFWLEAQMRTLQEKQRKQKTDGTISLDCTAAGECKPNTNEFEYLSLVEIHVNCAPLILTIDAVVMHKILSNPLSNL